MRVFSELMSKEWWKFASFRALRTAISVFLPFVAAGTLLEIDPVLAGSTIGLAVVVSYLTSLAGLKELTSSDVPKLIALSVRGVKTFAQTLVGFIGASVLITEVDWQSGLWLSLSAAVVTLLSGALTELPEAKESFAPVVE